MKALAPESALYLRRRIANAAAMALATAATAFGLVWLVWILWVTLRNGFEALGPRLFLDSTPPPGAEGGLANAFYGSLLIVSLALGLGAPVGVAAGAFLAEIGRNGRLAGLIRFVNDILLSAPSIVIGLFVYEIVVRPMGRFSAWAGAVALALILLPVVVRTTDEMLRLVPVSVRESALSLGLPQWKVTLQVLLRAARAGIATGVLLAVARISGETAPLLFTALNNQYWSTDLLAPMANVPVVIFQYAMSPYEAWHRLAWAGALMVTLFVLVVSVLARSLLRRRSAP